MPMDLSSGFSRYFTPVTMPSRVSLSAPVERRIRVHVKLLSFKMKLDISLIAVPRWASVPAVFLLTHVRLLSVLARQPAVARSST